MEKLTINCHFNSYVSLPEGISFEIWFGSMEGEVWEADLNVQDRMKRFVILWALSQVRSHTAACLVVTETSFVFSVPGLNMTCTFSAYVNNMQINTCTYIYIYLYVYCIYTFAGTHSAFLSHIISLSGNCTSQHHLWCTPPTVGRPREALAKLVYK